MCSQRYDASQIQDAITRTNSQEKTFDINRSDWKWIGAELSSRAKQIGKKRRNNSSKKENYLLPLGGAAVMMSRCR